MMIRTNMKVSQSTSLLLRCDWVAGLYYTGKPFKQGGSLQSRPGSLALSSRLRVGLKALRYKPGGTRVAEPLF
jgi:hypothetical protein